MMTDFKISVINFYDAIKDVAYDPEDDVYKVKNKLKIGGYNDNDIDLGFRLIQNTVDSFKGLYTKQIIYGYFQWKNLIKFNRMNVINKDDPVRTNDTPIHHLKNRISVSDLSAIIIKINEYYLLKNIKINSDSGSYLRLICESTGVMSIENDILDQLGYKIKPFETFDKYECWIRILNQLYELRQLYYVINCQDECVNLNIIISKIKSIINDFG